MLPDPAILFRLADHVQSLPCPVSSQGAHLVHPPPTPALRDSPIDPTFAQTLTDRLNKLVRRQEICVNMYGATFAEEWPISRTPMQEPGLRASSA